MAKSGYFGGDPEKVFSARVDIVMQAIDYEVFLIEYEEKEAELNKE